MTRTAGALASLVLVAALAVAPATADEPLPADYGDMVEQGWHDEFCDLDADEFHRQLLDAGASAGFAGRALHEHISTCG